MSKPIHRDWHDGYAAFQDGREIPAGASADYRRGYDAARTDAEDIRTIIEGDRQRKKKPARVKRRRHRRKII